MYFSNSFHSIWHDSQPQLNTLEAFLPGFSNQDNRQEGHSSFLGQVDHVELGCSQIPLYH